MPDSAIKGGVGRRLSLATRDDELGTLKPPFNWRLFCLWRAMIGSDTSLFRIHFLILIEPWRTLFVRLQTLTSPPHAKTQLSMRASIAFVFHLIGFGILATTLLAGFIVDRKFRSEPDFNLKLNIAKISRTIGLLSPFAALLMLASGIGNIHNRYLGSSQSWYDEGWLVAKIILYVVLVFNGLFYGPGLTRNRLKIVKAQAEQSATPNADERIQSLNKQITLFYIVQTLLFLFIIYISVFGSAKHPGPI